MLSLGLCSAYGTEGHEVCLIVHEKKGSSYSIENTPRREIVTVHKTLLRLIYASGLGSGELLRLKPFSSRTTEIYTNVSSKSIQQIKSPFDDLPI